MKIEVKPGSALHSRLTSEGFHVRKEAYEVEDHHLEHFRKSVKKSFPQMTFAELDQEAFVCCLTHPDHGHVKRIGVKDSIPEETHRKHINSHRAIISVLALVLILVLCVSHAHCQKTKSDINVIKFQSGGSPVKTFAGPFTLNCSTNLTCTASGSTLTMVAATGGAALAGGSNTQVQWNNATALAGISTMTTDGTIVTAKVGTNWLFVDPSSVTKKFSFDASNITAGQTRTVNVPDANSTTVQALTAVANTYVSGMSAQGVLSTAAIPVTSVASRTGAVTLTSTDVGLANVTNDAQTKAVIVPNTAPSSGQIQVGNAGGTAYAPQSLSSDCTLASTGAITCTKTNTVAFAASATTDTTNAANIGSGTLPAGRMPALTGAVTTSAGAVATSPGKIDVLDSSRFCQAAGASSTTYTCNLSPAITAYITGTHYGFKADVANTAASTINFNGQGAKTIKKAAGGITTDIAANDMQAGQWVDLVYDGTNMQMQSTLGNAGGGTGTVTSVATTSPITGGTITTTGTIACATCVVASSPGVGLAHFAGSTQTVTSSAVVQGDVTNGFVDLSTNQSVAGNKTLSGATLTKLLNNVAYCNDYAGADIFAQCNTAIGTLTAPGMVIIRPGSYASVTTTLACVDQIWIYGYGANVTYTGTTTAMKCQNVTHAGILGLKVTGPATTGSSIGLLVGIGSSGNGTVTEYNRFQDLIITVFNKGIALDGSASSNGTFQNRFDTIQSVSNNTGWYLVPTVNNQSNLNRFVNCTAIGSVQDGVQIDGSNGNSFDNFWAELNGRYGFNFLGTTSTYSNGFEHVWGEANTSGDFNSASGTNVVGTKVLSGFLTSTPNFAGTWSGTGNVLMTNARFDVYPSGSASTFHINSSVTGFEFALFNDEGSPTFNNVFGINRTGSGSGNGAGVLDIGSGEYPATFRSLIDANGQNINNVARFMNIRIPDGITFTGADIFAKTNAAVTDAGQPGFVVIPPGSYSVTTTLNCKDDLAILAYGVTATYTGTGAAVQCVNIAHGGIYGIRLAGPQTTLSVPGTPALSTSTSGGSLGAGLTVRVQNTFRSSITGETTVSAEATIVTGAGATNSVTVTAPTLPTGGNAYTVYSTTGATLSEKQQVVSGACVNITGNCVIQVIGAGVVPPSTNTAIHPSIGLQVGIGAGGNGNPTVWNSFRDIRIQNFGLGTKWDGTNSSNGTYWNVAENVISQGDGIGYYMVPTTNDFVRANQFYNAVGNSSVLDGFWIDGADGENFDGISAESNGRYGINLPGTATTTGDLFKNAWGASNTTADLNFGSATNIKYTRFFDTNFSSTTKIAGTPGGAFNCLQAGDQGTSDDCYGGSYNWHSNAQTGVADAFTIQNDESANSGLDVPKIFQVNRTGANAGAIKIGSSTFPLTAPAGLSTGSAPPACTAGTAGFWCAGEGTAPTNVASTAAIYADSTKHEYMAATNGASAATPGMMVRSQPSPVNLTAQTALKTTTTLCASAAGACNTAGQYRISWNFWGSGTACTVVTVGSVQLQLTWTDENAVAHTTIAMPMWDQKAGSMGLNFNFNTALGTEGASGSYIISTNGSVIQYATTYTACSTGTGTYNLRASAERVQ